MLIRIVRIHLKESGVSEFLKIFNANKAAIRKFEGCSHLELLKDKNGGNIYTTLSYWQNEESLNTYRDSLLFKNVWGSVKTLFERKADAFSLEKFIEV